MPQRIKQTETPPEPYTPDAKEQEVRNYLRERIPVLKRTKKNILNNDFDFEELMKQADAEYIPNSLLGKKLGRNSVYLETDESGSIRGSRVVQIGSGTADWRSNVSEPTLLVKIQIAISILVDQNPEATFKAILDKYKPITPIAEAIWKRSWAIAQSKEQLKNFIFNLAKYGWAPWRTYPRLVQRPKEVLTELDVENPEKNKYRSTLITEFNDIFREAPDPYRTWIDDMTNLIDPFSMDDCYYEMDFSRDTFDLQFSQYENSNKVKFGQKGTGDNDSDIEDGNEETSARGDIITIGFYESKNKDLYAIYAPNDDVVVYYSPLPNDDGLLSINYGVWNIRDTRTPYGIGLYEILKNNKVLYDRFDNMDVDALVMAIYTMLFYSGPNLPGDGTILIEPGVAKQKLPGTTLEQVKIDYDGAGREGAQQQTERIDEITGINPTLEGRVEGETLGEILHAKDAALKRLNIPLANIAHVLEQDAYLTLSWANQVYSLPEIMEFTDSNELEEFVEETGRTPDRVDASGAKVTADFPRQLDLSLSEDREGNLIEAPEDRFFTVGVDLPVKSIKWKGRIAVASQSTIAPSQELDRQRKMELFNLVMPIVQAITQLVAGGQFKVALGMVKPVIQILEIQNEKPENWLPDEVVQLLDHPELANQAQAQATVEQESTEPLFVDQNAPPTEGAPVQPMGNTQGIEPVVPRDDITNPVRESVEQIGAVPMV